jgi:hypothetical protein
VNRGRAAIVSLAVALTAIAAVVGVAHAVKLGPQARTATDAQVARRSAQLDRYRASLRARLAKRPPPLPLVPSTTSAASAQPPRVVYRLPAPVILHVRGDEQAGEGADD